MNINIWRPGLKAWLSQYVIVSSWDVRNPTEYNTTNGFIAPLQGLTFTDGATDQCVANQDIYLTSRHRGDLKYDELPLGDLEQLYSMVAQRLTTTYADIAPLQALEVIPVADCINVQEYGDDLGDWLVTLTFSLVLTWVPTSTALPGDLTVDPIVALKQIDVGLFKADLDAIDLNDPLTRNKYGEMPVDLQ